MASDCRQSSVFMLHSLGLIAVVANYNQYGRKAFSLNTKNQILLYVAQTPAHRQVGDETPVWTQEDFACSVTVHSSHSCHVEHCISYRSRSYATRSSNPARNQVDCHENPVWHEASRNVSMKTHGMYVDTHMVFQLPRSFHNY